jgi:hypothetical protein
MVIIGGEIIGTVGRSHFGAREGIVGGEALTGGESSESVESGVGEGGRAIEITHLSGGRQSDNR